MKGYRGKLMKKWLFLACLTLPHTLWVAEQGGRNKGGVVSPLLAVKEREEFYDHEELSQEEVFSPRSSRSSLPLMSPSSTMSPTSSPVGGIRLGNKSFNHRHPTNSKYPEDKYQLVGFYKKEDGTCVPLYRAK